MLPPRALWVSIVIALVFSFVLIFQPAIAQTPDGSATVSGVVVDEVSGMPVAGATVQLWYYPRFLSEYLSATTKGDGSYDIEVTLLPSEYVLCVEDNRGVVNTYASECYNDKPNIGEEQDVISIAEDDHLRFDFALARAGWVRGRVTSASSGAAIDTAFVSAYTPDGTLAGGSIMNENGDYMLQLAAGNYLVRAKPNDPWADGPGYRTKFYHNRYTPADADPYPVTAWQTATLNFQLEAGTVVRGEIFARENWAELNNVAVSVFDLHGNFLDKVFTDGQGLYELSGLGTGSYRFGYDATTIRFGDADYFSEFYEGQATLDHAIPVSVVAGDPPKRIDVALEQKPVVRSVATSPNLPNAITVSFQHTFTPTFTLNGGTTWNTFPLQPWIADVLPQAYDMLSVGVSSRQEITRPVRFMVFSPGPWTIGAKMFRTGDDGRAWSTEHLFDCSGTNEIGEVVVDPSNDANLYFVGTCIIYFSPIAAVSTSGNAYFRSVYYSLDHGFSWQHLRTGDAVAVPASQGGRIFVHDGDPAKWYYSDDLVSWTETAFNFDVLVPDEVSPQRHFGLQWESDYASSAVTVTGTTSSDGGATWTAIPMPCNTITVGDPTLVSIPGHSGVLMMNCTAEGTVKRSFDGGATWETLSDITDAHYLTVDRRQEGSVFVGKADGLWLSTDIGDHWTRLIAFPTEKWQPSVYLPLPLIKR